ncbi:MAG: PfkB family carbohydrate kinase [Thermodesulfobacteriota bacterium]
MERPARVAGLGQCSLDYIASVERFPAEDTKVEADGITIEGGGPVATALVSLARLGVETAFMGRVSDDEAGAEIIKGLTGEGVETSGLKMLAGGSSQVALIVASRASGTRTIIWKRPTVAALGPDEVDASLITGSVMLLVDGLMAEASMEAARIARGSGVPVMLDAGRLRPGMMELAAASDFVVASEEFSAAVAPTPQQTLRELAGQNPALSAATVTLGPAGSVTAAGGRTFSTPAFEVRAVDTTGAGDVFHGGYIYGILKGWGMEKTLRFASAFAAIKCTRPGGRGGIASLGETLEFMGA